MPFLATAWGEQEYTDVADSRLSPRGQNFRRWSGVAGESTARGRQLSAIDGTVSVAETSVHPRLYGRPMSKDEGRRKGKERVKTEVRI